MELMTIRSRVLADLLSDKELERFCLEQPELRIERAGDRTLSIMSPTYTLTGNNNSEIIIQLGIWNRSHKLGLLFDSSTGFFLPSGAMRSPDASFIAHERWNALTPADRDGFARICPEFVVELKSQTDSLVDLQLKMEEWLVNGCQLAWLVDVAAQTAYMYRPDQAMNRVVGFDQTLSGEAVLPGFELELWELKN